MRLIVVLADLQLRLVIVVIVVAVYPEYFSFPFDHLVFVFLLKWADDSLAIVIETAILDEVDPD